MIISWKNKQGKVLHVLNRVVLIGRLTKDPELRYTPNGVAVSNWTLAVDRAYKNAQGERETDFIPCVAYRKLAEMVTEYLSKGKLAAVDGRIQVRTYTAQDGQKRWVTEIIAEDVRFLSPRDSDHTAGHTNTPSGGHGSSTRQTGAHGGQNDTYYGHEVQLDDDIPF